MIGPILAIPRSCPEGSDRLTGGNVQGFLDWNGEDGGEVQIASNVEGDRGLGGVGDDAARTDRC